MADTIKSNRNEVHGQVVVNDDGSPIGQILPTSGFNPSLSLAYSGSELQTITKTIDGVQYQKTLTYTGSNLTGISNWEII